MGKCESFPQTLAILSASDEKPKPGETPANTARKKRESWEMAMKLYQAGRISLAMALYGLKSSGHTKEEAAQWVREANLKEQRCLMSEKNWKMP